MLGTLITIISMCWLNQFQVCPKLNNVPRKDHSSLLNVNWYLNNIRSPNHFFQIFVGYTVRFSIPSKLFPNSFNNKTFSIFCVVQWCQELKIKNILEIIDSAIWTITRVVKKALGTKISKFVVINVSKSISKMNKSMNVSPILSENKRLRLK